MVRYTKKNTLTKQRAKTVKRRRTAPRKRYKPLPQITKNKILSIVNKGRELKKLWSKISPNNPNLTIPNGERILLFNPTATLVDTTLPAYPPIQSLGDTAENYFRQGNQIQPVMFRCKGYAYIANQNVDDKRMWATPTNVRLVAGFRNRSTPLVIGNPKLQLQGGTTVDIEGNSAYEAVLNPFNWAEFKPFYDKTFQVTPVQDDDANFTSTQFKSWFNFDIKYHFPKNAKKLISRETEGGANDALFDNRNIYVMAISRQLAQMGSQDYYNITFYGTSYFSFYDS